jgi:RNA polymerase sigma factor (sigma-70 family)
LVANLWSQESIGPTQILELLPSRNCQKTKKTEKTCAHWQGSRLYIHNGRQERHDEGDLNTRFSPLVTLLQAVKRGLDERPDHRLLADFLDHHDEEAFEHLVQRHARHVWSVCHRLLGNSADAEDAFQATFVVLIRSGRMIADRGPLGGWLYRVAYRVALRARAMVVRRRQKEQAAAATAEAAASGTPIDPDLSEALNEELGRLPEACRLAVLLCDLDGLSRKEVAGKLGWKETTLAGRLNRGRKMLADRLRDRGFTAPLVLAAAGVATFPASVVASTVSLANALVVAGAGIASGAVPSTVAELATGILGDMTMRITTKVLATAVLVAGILGGIVSGFGLHDSPTAATAAPPPTARPAPHESKAETAPVEGQLFRVLELKPDANGKVKVPVMKLFHFQPGMFGGAGIGGAGIGGFGGGFGGIGGGGIGGGGALGIAGIGGGIGGIGGGGIGGGGALGGGGMLGGGGFGGGGAFGGAALEWTPLDKLKDLTVTTAAGKEISKEDALKRLAKGGIVVISADGNKISPAYLKVFKDDVLVLISPELVDRGLSVGVGGGGQTAPAPSDSRPKPAPTNQQLAAAKDAYAKLGATYEYWTDPRTRTALPVQMFHMPNTTADEDLKVLPDLPFRFALDLGQTKVTDAGVAELQKRLPELKIIR